MTEAVLMERRDATAILTLNNAPYNALGLDTIDALEQHVATIAGDPGIRAVVLTAGGDTHFSVGMNLKQFGEGIEREGSIEALLDQRLRVIDAIENMGKPWVVTLFGYCLGGGLEIPLGCHFRLAADEGCQIGLPELELGTVPAWGGSARLTRCVGREHALDIILRSKKISGPEAHRIGLVQEVWPQAELLDRAIALADQLAAQPALAVKGMLDLIVGSETHTLDELIQKERDVVTATLGSADSNEGLSAFMEKRKPVFNQN